MFHTSEIEIPQRKSEIVFSEKGLQDGPSLVIVGRVGEMEKIAERMSKIPSLAYMRGSITIYSVEDGAATCAPEVDDVLVLLDGSEAFTTNPTAALYWKVLARAAALGIIAGRGVPFGKTQVTWH